MLEYDRRLSAETTTSLSSLLAYLTELRNAIDDRLHDRHNHAAPPADDPRMALTNIRTPSLAPYEAAKQNGMVALLPIERIRIYNRMTIQLGFFTEASREWRIGLGMLDEFKERFVDSRGSLETSRITLAPELGDLTPGELGEYLVVVSTLIKRTDLILDRYSRIDAQCKIVLNGVRTEDELLAKMTTFVASQSQSLPTVIPGHR